MSTNVTLQAVYLFARCAKELKLTSLERSTIDEITRKYSRSLERASLLCHVLAQHSIKDIFAGENINPRKMYRIAAKWVFQDNLPENRKLSSKLRESIVEFERKMQIMLR